MKALKWTGHGYGVVEIPDGNYPAITDNMDEPCTCPHCGRDFPFGEMYTSHELFRAGGCFGFYVCEECYWRERKWNELK